MAELPTKRVICRICGEAEPLGEMIRDALGVRSQCKACLREFAARRVKPPDDPEPDEIAARCEEIRNEWSDKTAEARRVLERRPYEIPVVRVGGGHG